MKLLLMVFLSAWGLTASSQISRVSLQASGLTCSMCSKAVKVALEKVDGVDKVQVDIKNQQYNINFKEPATVNLDALAKAVEDAGFGVSKLQVTASVSQTVEKDTHIKIGESYFHFLNAGGQKLEGPSTFTLVDKSFVSAREFKKFSGLSKMSCVQTGKTASCCPVQGAEEARIYHAML